MRWITSELGKKLKELGYPMPLVKVWDSKTPIMYDVPITEENWADCDAWYLPTYLEVWNWLWKIKNIHIEVIDCKITSQCYATINGEKDTVLCKSPEDAIILAIDYLDSNNLI